MKVKRKRDNRAILCWNSVSVALRRRLYMWGDPLTRRKLKFAELDIYFDSYRGFFQSRQQFFLHFVLKYCPKEVRPSDFSVKVTCRQCLHEEFRRLIHFCVISY